MDEVGPGATRIAPGFTRSFQVTHNPPAENWRYRQIHPRINFIGSISGETNTRVADFVQSARLASGLKAALLCAPTILMNRLPDPAAGSCESKMSATFVRSNKSDAGSAKANV